VVVGAPKAARDMVASAASKRFRIVASDQVCDCSLTL
jgi:hypothetical protein